jgi:hypothetical protein
VERYLQIANREGLDAVLTISNQIVSKADESPVTVDGRRLRKVRLRHLSWFRILTEAVIESQHRGVDDPDQAWMLSELIEFLDDERSGAAGFDGMGPSWVKVRDAAKARTLRAADAGVRDVAENWEAFIEYLALRLYQRLGSPVSPSYPRKMSRADRINSFAGSLGDNRVLEATIKIPDAAAPIDLQADLGSRLVTTSARISAPREGKPKTRINWLLRQLKDAPTDVRVEVRFSRSRTTTALLLPEALEDPAQLLLPEDPKREPSYFDVALTRDMGTKRGKVRGSFVAATMDQVGAFYAEVLERIHAWTPSPPKLKPPSSLSELEDEDQTDE